MKHLRALARTLALVAADSQEDELGRAAAWFVEGFKRYVDGAAAGLDLATALGLRSVGTEAWWTIEARARRDELIRQAAAGFGDISLSAAANEICREMKRNARRAQAPAGGPAALLAEAARLGEVPASPRTIRGILAVKPPVFIANGAGDDATESRGRP
jgi:hypothetical protein